MKYADLTLLAKRYAPAQTLDALLFVGGRRVVRRILGGVTAVCGLYALLVHTLPEALSGHLIPHLAPLAEGVALLCAGWYVLCLMFEFFYNSYYFEEIDPNAPKGVSLSFEFASIVNHTRGDAVYAFAASSFGREILLRAGLSFVQIEKFLQDRQQGHATVPDDLPMRGDMPRISDLLLWALEHDQQLIDALFAAGVKEEDVLGACEWFERRSLAYKRFTRTWGREYLGRIPSIARDWSYGRAYALDRFATYIRDMSVYQSIDSDSPRGAAETRQLEAILSRSSGANAILVGSEGSGTMDVVARLAHSIYDGTVLPALGHREVVVFNAEGMVASMGNKAVFEQGLLQVFNQSYAAGNIILVVPNFSAFMESARVIGSDVLSLIEPYLSSTQLQIVLLVDPDPFYRVIEGNPQIMAHFEVVKIEIADTAGTIRLLAEAAQSEEFRNRMLFTYPALVEIARSATRYFPGGVMPDKAIDLLREIVPVAKRKNQQIIGRQQVLDLVESKTGIPLGTISAKEKDKLLNLESILHERIVGQDEAVKGVSEAMRRARAGIRNQDRPMGLFLFLGPTGVGKTETAKALSDLFFGERHPMMRLDMSEYNAPGSVEKLIGSFDTNRAGTLAIMLKETPYGVLLLDEFEKSAPEVKDLFLQVFDEGMFSDKSGKKINARNVIIVATSNAGSQMIWEYFKAGEDVSKHKKELIDAIINDQSFKPELINRFDGVIIFHPLAEEGLRSIATLMLKRFAERLRREKGIGLTVSDALVSYVMRFGVDPQFGARPMNRAIQDTVEKVIAEKIIKGELRTGETIELTSMDFEQKT